MGRQSREALVGLFWRLSRSLLADSRSLWLWRRRAWGRQSREALGRRGLETVVTVGLFESLVGLFLGLF